MKIRAKLLAMASSGIMDMIDKDLLADIKAKDSSPMLKAFVVGHEGEARGTLIGVGNVVKKWFGDAIEKLSNKISVGLKLFHGHAATNDTEGRVSVGEVVGKNLLNIKDRLSSVVACWIYPAYRHLPLDVASIEADIDLVGDSQDRLYVADVNEISGIALGNSETETPGFPGATLLGQLQAFAEITLNKGDNKMTLAELKQAIQEGKFTPSDVFGQEAIFADPTISEQVREKVSNASGYNIRKLEDSIEERAALKKKLEDAETKVTEAEKEKDTLKLESAKSKVDSLFDTQKTERKLDEKQVKFIQNRLGGFTPQKVEDVEKELNAHLDSELKEYETMAKDVFGIEIEKKKDDDLTGPEDKKPDAVDNKYLDPAQNPMIKP